MKRIKTLRVRFALWTSGLFFVILTGFSVFVYIRMSRNLYAAIDDSLTLNASQIVAGLDIENNLINIPTDFLDESENAELRERGFTVQILTRQGEILQKFGLHQALLPHLSSKIVDPFFSTISDPSNETTIRVYTTPVIENGQPIALLQAAQSLEQVQDTLERLFLTFLVSVPMLVTIAGFSGYFLAARALAPIDQITLTARRISAEDLSARLNIPVIDDEVGRLAQTFDEMLERLDDAFKRERQFTNDASHELRTPLTAMQAVLGMIREKPRATEEYQQALDDISEETERLITLTENLLNFARRDGKNNSVHEPVNVSTLLGDVTDSMRPLAEAKGLKLKREIEDNLYVRGDSDDLIRLFVNLLDNAIKFTEHGEIYISAEMQNNAVKISIEDTGIGIGAEHLPHIFDRFYRTDKSRATPGSGLGLSIAQEIVQAHGGKIEVTNAMDKGSNFIIYFPV